MNKLIRAAEPLLILLAALPTTTLEQSVNGLREKMVRLLDEFSDRLSSENTQSISTAQYWMCAALDECILSQAWAEDSGYSDKTLLVLRFAETNAGEAFYEKLEALFFDPVRNKSMLEFAYWILWLGYQGKYIFQEQIARLHFMEKLRRIILEHQVSAKPSLLISQGNSLELSQNQTYFRNILWRSAIVLLTIYFFSNLYLYIEGRALREVQYRLTQEAQRMQK